MRWDEKTFFSNYCRQGVESRTFFTSRAFCNRPSNRHRKRKDWGKYVLILSGIIFEHPNHSPASTSLLRVQTHHPSTSFNHHRPPSPSPPSAQTPSPPPPRLDFSSASPQYCPPKRLHLYQARSPVSVRSWRKDLCWRSQMLGRTWWRSWRGIRGLGLRLTVWGGAFCCECGVEGDCYD